MKVYKVVYDESVKGMSEPFTSLYAAKQLCVEYSIGKWAWAPAVALNRGYGLVAFDSLDNAWKSMLVDYRNRQVILECECEPDDTMTLAPRLLADGDSLLQEELIPCSWPWPEGTVMCRKLMPIRLIPYEEYVEVG